ncbi:MAG: hypothetical protein OXF56_10240 [Rhodobacteraceae bacterium]|nr:hypothetical protein [Paracoccaceae bacterium]
MNVIEQVRQDREDLARVLKKHAGIRKIVEDLYPDSAHFIYELLQNAEDTGASEASFVLSTGGLVFEHNGRAFDKADIRAITDIGEGTKAEDDEQIGRFGIGFKAVFAYTETPHIWSPTYSFKISEMVLPSALPPDPNLGVRTRFAFPFNSGKKQPARAYSEIRDGLEEISDNTLLFLSHIEATQWRIDGGSEGRLLRIPHSDRHLEILREIDGRSTESSHFLRFSELVEGLERQHIAIAFELARLSGEQQSTAPSPFAKQFRIVPAEPGCVAVYFTAAKETSNLRFHLHAPFVPELSRSSIKNSPANKPLFRQLAGLAARALSAIRDLGLLDRDFLAVLPNGWDEIPAQYTTIQDAIVDAMNEHPLTPKYDTGHAPASRLLQAEAGLKDLLDREDIRLLTYDGDDRCDWAIAATQRNSRVDRFIRGLDIEEWGVKQFVETLDERLSNRQRLCYSPLRWEKGPDQPFLDWIRQKPPDWHRALYALFHRELADDLDRFDRICIVRRSDGQYGTGSECYFPTPEAREDAIHPRVAEDTFTGGGTKNERTRARAFLEGIGVREIGEHQQIEAILERRYADAAGVPSWDIYVSDLRRFISFVEKNRNASTIFESHFIFRGANGLWYRPSGLFLDSPYLETGLDAYYGPLASDSDRMALSDSYQAIDITAQLVPFAQACGVADRLEISAVKCTANPEQPYLESAPGAFFTDTGIDRDFVIPGLRALFEKPTLALSGLVWNTLSDRSHDRAILKATFQYNRSNDPHYAASQLVHQLRDAAWIPQRDNQFVRPAEAERDLLPKGFPFDPGWLWLAAINFGAETEEHTTQLRRTHEIATELGFADEAALADGRRFAELAPDIRQRILASHSSPPDLPTHEPGNPSRRAESVRKQARKAPGRKKEKRPRSVSVNRDSVKREKTNPYLRELYTNADGDTICQVCQGRLPFKLADGSYYFEAVELLSELEKHHHQNYVALCPNHAAMFIHTNPSKEDMKRMFLALDGNELELALADRPVSVYFTDTHIADLNVIIEVNDEG